MSSGRTDSTGPAYCSTCGIAFCPLKSWHQRCWDCWRDNPGAGNTYRTTSASPAIDRALIRDAVLLCHPDRHPAERGDLATRVTARLLDAMRRLPASRGAA